MATKDFSSRLQDYQKWREGLTAAVSDYQKWVEQNEQNEEVDGEEDLQIYELIESLNSDKLIVGLVGEFSRGKSELLNAIFFSSYDQRLLPSSAGRTTMCPTELRFDEKVDPCIKLLPIETRKTSITIEEYKGTPVHWTTIHIHKVSDVSEVSKAFQEITKTKWVHEREAEDLGLYDPNDSSPDAVKPKDGKVEVPLWRQAIINFPHPLLKQGLVVLDTPGLNALGAEPELTMSMLPRAHAILFLLAADAGVTKTDLDIWENHINIGKSEKGHERIVILNKIDHMWDEMAAPGQIDKAVREQVGETARTLKVNESAVVPVSAKYGLIGKIKKDPQMVSKGGLDVLEEKLTNEIIPAKHEIIRNRVVYAINARVEKSKSMLDAQSDGIKKRIADMETLGNKNLEDIQKMVGKMREEKAKYDKEMKGFMETRNTLGEQAKKLFNHLSMDRFDQLIKKTRKDMQESWTTQGLKRGVKVFFDGAAVPMEEVRKQANEIKELVEVICRKLHLEYGLSEIKPVNLSLIPYVMQLKKLEAKAEAFRNSASIVVSEQNAVIEKFFITMVSEARNIFLRCNQASKSWFQNMGAQVYAQIQQHKKDIDKDIESLRKIHENMDSLSDELNELRSQKRELDVQLKTVTDLLARIHNPV